MLRRPLALLLALVVTVLITALPLTDEAGYLLAVLVIGQHWWRTRRARHATAVR